MPVRQVASPTRPVAAMRAAWRDSAARPAGWWLPPSFRGRLLMIAAGALLLRVLYVALDVAGNKGFDDRLYFHDTANNIAAGRGFIEPYLYDFLGRTVPSAGHPPLWPTVLAVPSFFGLDSWTAHQFVTVCVGSAAVVAIGVLGNRVGGPRVGLIAAALAAVSPLLIARDGSLLSESLYGLLVVCALLAAYRVVDRPVPRSAALLGVLIGLAALTRGEGLLFVPLLAIPVCIRARPRGTSRKRLAAVAIVATVVTIVPWTVRNWIVFDDPVVISLNDASVLGGANCPATYNGDAIGGWQLDCLARRNVRLSEPAQHAIWRRQGFTYIGDHLDQVPKVMVYRVLRAWDLYQPSAQAHGDGRDYNVAVLGTWTYLLFVLPAGILGAMIMYRRRSSLLILLSPVLVTTVAAALTWGLTRLRHPVDLVLLVLDAVAITTIVDRIEGRDVTAPLEAARTEPKP
jgi:Dolichyl-phosphate-mannose-protein mannosyltransferase